MAGCAASLAREVCQAPVLSIVRSPAPLHHHAVNTSAPLADVS